MTTTKTLGPAEARVQAAEQKQRDTEERLMKLSREHAALQASMPARVRAQTQELRRAVDKVNTALQAQHAETAQLAGELEAAQAEIAALKQALKPPVQEQLVAVRWLRDAPPGGASINDRVYRGAAGDVVLMPEGAAAVLADQTGAARFVQVLGAAALQANHRAYAAQLSQPGTAEEMRARAAELELLARDLDHAQAREAEQAKAAAGEG